MGGAGPLAMTNPQDGLRNINCTQCGAPLELHGGHRVRSITCAYCGSMLDTRDEYRVVRKFLDTKRPASPVRLGMAGRIKGVEFTVIGMLAYQTTDAYGWIEFLMFSPTHGYAWLEQEGGHFVFSHRVRDMPDPPVTGGFKSTFKARGQTFKVYEHCSAKVAYVEGELTWVANAGDVVHLTEGVAPPCIYSIERTEGEEEYSFGEYLPAAEVYTAFDIDEKPPYPSSVHGAQPYLPTPWVVSLSQAAKYVLPLALLLLVAVLVFGNGEPVLRHSIDPRGFLAGAGSPPFQVDDPNALMALELHSPLDNAWAWFDVSVMQGEEAVLSLSELISFYQGYEGGEHWSEGSQYATAYFKVPAAGSYSLYVTGKGGVGETGATPQNRSLHLVVSQGVMVSRYFVILAAVLGVAYLLRHLLRWRFEAKRWGDDDD